MAALAVVCLAHPAYPVDPNRMLSQYVRDHWGVEQGFTGGSVTSFAQTPDGYLWIGTEKGLIRFDGLTFRLFQQASPTTFPIGAVQGLVTDAQGNLWIRLQSTKILRYHDGKFELGREEAEFGITSLGRRGDGTVLFSSLILGLLTHRAGRFEILTSPADRAPSEGTATTETDNRSTRLSWATQLAPHRFAEPNSVVMAMAESTDGKLWLGTRDKGLFYMSAGRVFAAGKGQSNSRINCLLALENRELWVGTDEGVARWNGAEATWAGVSSSLRHIQVLSMIRDHDSNIWVGTAGGLIRVNGEGVSVDGGSSPRSGAVTALFEDREGNLWVGHPSGIERLRDSAFVSYSIAGRQSESGGPIYVDEDGRVWFALFDGSLQWLKGAERGRVTNDLLEHDVVYSIAGARGELWIGRQRGGLTHLRYGAGSVTTKTYTQADGLAQNSVYAVHKSRDGTVWSGTLSGGVSELKNGHFKSYTTTNGLPSNTISSIAEGSDGTMWFGTPKGLTELSRNGWRNYADRDGLISPDITCLSQDSTGVLWIGTAAGLAFLRNGHVQTPLGTQEWLREPIFGMVEDSNGGLWVATSTVVLRAKRSSLTSGQVLNDSDFHLYRRDDGFPGTEGVKRFRSVVRDSQGNVWFSTSRGLSSVNPDRSAVNSIPALLHIEAVTLDSSEVNFRQPIRVSPGEHRIVFHYLGLSLANPERVRYRYRLDGFDRGWSEVVNTREATFANLSPGTYRFRVMCSNSDGIWNPEGASIDFSVLPTLYQTNWFRVLCLIGFLASLWAIYQFRVRQLQRRFNIVLDARVNERTRIAQDLHDTLLQGFISASMQLGVADRQLPADWPAKPIVTDVLKLMRDVIEEGRKAVRGMRLSSGDSDDLERAFLRIPQELVVQRAVGFRVLVEGRVRTLHPIIRDEVYRIGREALVNAFRHSQAARVEVELEYADRELRVLVRDNGCGIDPKVLQSGRDGHWGLSGMRERAGRIGARLKVWSDAAAGTEVELSVPRRFAYRLDASSRGLERFAGLGRRKGGDHAQKPGNEG